jgi:site-specific recombinase XerD
MKREGFLQFLKHERLQQSSIHEHMQNLKRFKEWATKSGYTTIERLNYNELLGYVHDLKKKGLAVSTINIRLNSLRKYYDFIKEQGITEFNPAKNLHIKGAVKTIIHQPLTYQELEELYGEYTKERDFYREQKHREAHKRNGIVLGLMIWQGIHSGELQKLQVEHVDLSKGTIYIPATRRSNSREIKLEVRQIISLHHYLTETSFTTTTEGLTPLFNNNTHNMVQALVQELKGLNGQIKNAAHIRSSVILHWLRMYDKRTVQHMAGHKYISSVEHYQVQELTGLTDLLTKHHPFS